MKVTYRGEANNILEIDDARIIFKNFRGEGGKYNREGDMNFALVIDNEDLAEDLKKDGWNIKIKAPQEEGDYPFMFLSVKVKFNEKGPSIHLNTNGKVTRLNEETVAMLDNIDIEKVDMDIRAYDWEVNGQTGRAAYLSAMNVIQRVDRFSAKYINDGVDIGNNYDIEYEKELTPSDF